MKEARSQESGAAGNRLRVCVTCPTNSELYLQLLGIRPLCKPPARMGGKDKHRTRCKIGAHSKFRGDPGSGTEVESTVPAATAYRTYRARPKSP